MSNVRKLETGYRPKVEPLKDLKLPIELKNYKGETIASIQYWEGGEYTRKGYHAFVNSHHIYEYGHKDLTECLGMTFSYLYQKMQDYRKQAEEYQEVRKALQKALS